MEAGGGLRDNKVDASNGGVAGGAGGGVGGAAGAWSEVAVRTLLDSYTGKFMELQRSNLRQKDWQDVLARLAATCGEGYNYARCRNKLDSLKKKFKNVRSKKGSSGRAGIKWKWYDHMERLMERGPSTGQGIPGGIASGEKVGRQLLDDANTDEEAAENHGEDENDDNTSAAASLDEEEAGNEMLLGGASLSSLFDSRANGNAGVSAAGAGSGAFLGGERRPNGGLLHQGTTNRLHKVGEKPMKKKASGSSGGTGAGGSGFVSHQQLKEVAALMIESLEKIEKKRMDFEEKRMEMLREMEMRRNETNLQIAKLIVGSSQFKFQAMFTEDGNASGGLRKDASFPQ